MSKSLTEMSIEELKAYLFDHKNDDLQWSQAYEEFRTRPGWTNVPADTPIEEQERILEELIARKITKAG
jgi:hypothetical protein